MIGLLGAATGRSGPMLGSPLTKPGVATTLRRIRRINAENRYGANTRSYRSTVLQQTSTLLVCRTRPLSQSGRPRVAWA